MCSTILPGDKMKKINRKKMEKDFLLFAEKFEDTIVEWHEYDPANKQVFIWVEGKWDLNIKYELKDYLRENFHNKILVSRMVYSN